MKAFDKQILHIFVVLTTMPVLTVLIGSAMNYLFSWVFLCPFEEIQTSSIWIVHVLLGLFFTVSLLINVENHAS